MTGVFTNFFLIAADATIKIWNTATGTLVHTFEGHLAGISTISWSPDGETIASGSDDKSIRLWDVVTVCTRLYANFYYYTAYPGINYGRL